MMKSLPVIINANESALSRLSKETAHLPGRGLKHVITRDLFSFNVLKCNLYVDEVPDMLARHLCLSFFALDHTVANNILSSGKSPVSLDCR
jgi:hypothetical protein